MARTSLTKNLKLRLAPTLSEDSRYNLERLDILGGTTTLTDGDDTVLRAKGKIILEPRSTDLGASLSDPKVIELQVQGTEVQLNSAILVGAASLSLTNGSFSTQLVPSPSQTQNLTLTLPASITAGYFLSVDAGGQLSWQSPGAVAAGEYSATWVPADGAIKTVTHGLNSYQVMVQVIDTTDSYRTIDLDVTRPSVNQVQLDASQVPSGNWLVLIKRIS